MAVTAPTAEERSATPGRTGATARRLRIPGAPTLLLGALLLALAYGAFAHGAAQIPDENRLQVALALVAIAACVAWLLDSGLRLRSSRLGWVGVGLLVAFVAWTALSLAWSVAPDRTWTEFNRATMYAVVLVLGMCVGSSHRRALELLAVGWLVIASAVALYALGGKVAPWIHVGPIDLDHTAGFSRLRAPLDYWNALALVLVMAAPVALRAAVERALRMSARLAALAALYLFVVVIALTYSRGGVVALVIALAVAAGLARARVHCAVLVVATFVASVPALAFALTAHSLTTDGVPVSDRAVDGLILAALMAVSCAALLAAAWRLDRFNVAIPPAWRGSRRLVRGVAAAAAVALVIAMVGFGVSDRGLGGTVSAQVNKFTQIHEQRLTDPNRLLSTNAGNRWVWWKEAAGAFSDRPVAGWGAGSFPVLHLQYRHNHLSVLQPHSVPLQLLAETGVVGALLVLGAVVVLIVAGVRRVLGLPFGPARGAAAALAAAAIAWAVHGIVDWDWDMPGVTLPAMAFLGVLAARYTPPVRPMRGLRSQPLRALGAGAAILVLVCVALSAAFPAISDSLAGNALASVPDRPTDADLRRAASDARLSSDFNPLSVEGPLAESAIELRRGNLVAARKHMLEAASRQPDNPQVWRQLAGVELARRDARAAQRAIDRALALDPLDYGELSLAGAIVTGLTPPNGSATATGTPLPPAPPPVPAVPAPAAPVAPAAPPTVTSP
jgi:hypothetical protein